MKLSQLHETKYPSGRKGGSQQVWNFHKPKKTKTKHHFADQKIISQKEQDNRLLPQFRGQSY